MRIETGFVEVVGEDFCSGNATSVIKDECKAMFATRGIGVRNSFGIAKRFEERTKCAGPVSGYKGAALPRACHCPDACNVSAKRRCTFAQRLQHDRTWRQPTTTGSDAYDKARPSLQLAETKRWQSWSAGKGHVDISRNPSRKLHWLNGKGLARVDYSCFPAPHLASLVPSFRSLQITVNTLHKNLSIPVTAKGHIQCGDSLTALLSLRLIRHGRGTG